MIVKMSMLKILCLCFIAISNVVSQNLVIKSRSVRSGNCILPSHPSFGRWSCVTQKTLSSPGIEVPVNSILEIRCDDTYKLVGNEIIVCLNGTWVQEMGRCLKTCPPIHSTSTMNVTCTYKGEETVDCVNAVEDTLAQFKCASFYEDPRKFRPKAICMDGKWSEKIPECEAVCGKSTVKEQVALIVSGKKAKKGEFPWQIALYTSRDEELICGGTLLSEKVVLTAAHCVCDERGTMFPKNDYIVVAGKYYRKFDHPDDQPYTQTSKIHEMYVPDRYMGDEKSHEADIAIIIPKLPFKFTTRIQPVCIDWDRKYDWMVLESGRMTGCVSGWGKTRQNSQPASELKSLRVPTIPRKECQKFLDRDFRRYMTNDKFCAGYRNKGASVCGGDSGGGLVFEDKEQFFIVGIVSVAPLAESPEGGCNSQLYSLYTLVYNYTYSFIYEKLKEFDIADENSVVTSTTVVPPKRRTTVSPTGASTTALPSSLGTCPSLYNSSKMKATCSYNNKNLPNCKNPVDGTTAKFKCSQFYEFTTVIKKPSICIKGKWSFVPKCVPACGTKSFNSSSGHYPWHVTIYSTDAHEAMCVGTLINSKVVITVAHCVTDFKGNVLPKDNFIVAVSKNHREFQSKELDAQFSEPKEILVPKVYKGDIDDYLGDVAVIVVEKPFAPSTKVQPVCIDWTAAIPQDHKTGLFSGWSRNKSKKNKFRLSSSNECKNSADAEYAEFLTDDKFCAKILTKDSSLCKSNFGAGLVFKKSRKYYLGGVLSMVLVPPEDDTCDLKTSVLFTKIATYTDNFILEVEAKYRD